MHCSFIGQFEMGGIVDDGFYQSQTVMPIPVTLASIDCKFVYKEEI